MNNMQDVFNFKPQYDWATNPVGQLISVDSRTPEFTITGRYCSGFNINSHGLFLTAGHRLPQVNTNASLEPQYDTRDYRVSFNFQINGGQETIYPIQTVFDAGSCSITPNSGQNLDFTLLKLPAKAAQTWGYLLPITNLPPVGAPIIAVAHPQNAPKKISFGTASNLPGGLITHSAHLEPGSSGGPLSANINSTAVALGVNTDVSVNSGDTPNSQLHCAVPISSIAKKSRHVAEESHLLDLNGIFRKIRVRQPAPESTSTPSRHITPSYRIRGN